MTNTAVSPDLLPLGADGVLVRFSTRLEDAANRAVLAFSAVLETDPPLGCVEISTALASVFVRFDPDLTTRAVLIDTLQNRLGTRDWTAETSAAPARHWHIPTAFGDDLGPQLTETAALLGMSEQDAVADIVAHPLRVLAIGFAPGQPYLGMLPERWDIPRLQEMTPSVPGGALVVAVRQLIVFSGPTPTGWRHIGQTAFRPFRVDSPEPFPLLPGDVLHFEPVSAEDYDRILRSDTDGSGGARLEVAQ
ncbi:allophanate hydrolase subunit 1 [Rhodobacteraceae bacterium D3-12]|nr:allophanate hydrolase subunit 1 [Rhodobacteraceae bacterium D3-12]